ncbi:MAG TPA: tRNA pseudouridine(55) synthase TruB [Bacteroidota bacterium]|jgi:tRNA pseudouridine55 synthase|nr:tRNA pseudouridine(55) synthase TruB [Bacteroidota bacterium]
MNDSILFIDKPIDWTSFDVVKKVRSVLHLRKVGHAGTLDPKATGLLILGTGSKTKELNQYVGLEKEYVGVMELGVQTPSYDSETEVIEHCPFDEISKEQIYTTAQKFVGAQTQIPPMYSAVKYGGKPLYRFARQGEELPRAERTIMIYSFDITSIALPSVDFRVVCSKGTYIRSLVNDFGNALECGATLRSLRRVRIGSFSVDSALTISALESLVLSNRGE